MTTLLSSREIAALNRARAVLKRLEEGAWHGSLSHYDPLAPVTAWDLGRLSEAACVADDAILHVLATARANCQVKVTDAQLFGPGPALDPGHEGEPALTAVPSHGRGPEPELELAPREADTTPLDDVPAVADRQPRVLPDRPLTQTAAPGRAPAV